MKKIVQYSSKAKKDLICYCKLYNMDVCFNSLRMDNNRYDLDHNLDYNELIYRGYNVKVFTYDNKELDFKCEKDGKIYFVQVAYSVENEKAYNREIYIFENIDNLNKKILITLDPIDYSTYIIKNIKFKDFLLMDLID